MSKTRIRIDPADPATLPEGRIDPAVVDGAMEAEIAVQKREDAFESWLEQGGALSAKSRRSRIDIIRRLERNLEALEIPFRDLETAWKADRFESLGDRLRRMQEDARAGGQDYRILMPDSRNPHKRLTNWRSKLAQYGRFLDGEPPGSAKDADRIRRYVLKHYIEPARDDGHAHSEVLVRDVHTALGLKRAWPNVCQAIAGRKFQELARVPAPETIGAEQSSATVFRFDVSGRGIASSTLNRLPSDISEVRERSMSISPVNLVLYGPPGTGKTFSTAAEAVRLCGEDVPQDREALMETYQRLVEMRRIEFVTFHQSMSYEDFVEGRQPTTESDENDGSSSGGFRLETVHGIFRRIAKRAQTSQGRSAEGEQIAIGGRQVFKMSIGEANNPEDAYLFDEAIDGGYALLGWEDIDWSDEKYDTREAIIQACRTRGQIKGHADVSAQSGAVQMPFIFRNWVKKGDIVIVSKGNLRFRAIGEFTGDYEFKPRPEGGYAHRRAVRWHWMDRDGVSVSEIYTRRFSQKTIYLLFGSELKVPALERYLNSQKADGPAKPEPFVLIIDEINRANISKVFGELITLLEPDKRLGQPNELKVRLPYSGDEFGVPPNLHILGTMNTADRSIALLDTALRRRFRFREMMPDPSLLAGAAEECGLELPQILNSLNERIEYFYDREHQIGHAYFIDCKSPDDVDAVMRDKVIPLLAEYFFEDWGKVAAVLGDAVSHDREIEGGFLNRSVLKAPPGFEDGDDLPRFRWEVRSEEDGFDYKRLTEA